MTLSGKLIGAVGIMHGHMAKVLDRKVQLLFDICTYKHREIQAGEPET